MNTYAIPALKEKRAAIAGRIISLKKQLARHKRELVSLDATIHLFDPSYKVGSVKPKRPKNQAQLFKMGQLGRIIIDTLRRADGPLSSNEVVIAVAEAAGADKAKEPLLRPTVSANLSYMARRGKLVKEGKREGSVWRLA